MPADDAPRTSPKAASADNDHSCKPLLTHAEMVRDLLVGFVYEPWAKELQWGGAAGRGRFGRATRHRVRPRP
jgi:hypothetical protein